MKKREATQEEIDELIGTPKPELGAYLARRRCSALVYEVSDGQVHAVYLGGMDIEIDVCPIAQFVADYPMKLDSYSVQTAAQAYLKSPRPKSPAVLAQLRILAKGKTP